MKIIIFYFFVGFISHSTLAGSVQNQLFSINDIADGVFGTVRKIMRQKGFEPMTLPDYQASLLHLGLIEISVGKLSLTECKFFNLSTIYRNNDVLYDREGATYDVQTPVAFNNLKLNCSYEASLLGLIKKKGVVVVNLPDLSAQADMDIAVIKFNAQLKDLKLIENGFIDVHLEGGILDNLGSILTETISNLLKNVIIKYVEAKLKVEIGEILEGEKEPI